MRSVVACPIKLEEMHGVPSSMQSSVWKQSCWLLGYFHAHQDTRIHPQICEHQILQMCKNVQLCNGNTVWICIQCSERGGNPQSVPECFSTTWSLGDGNPPASSSCCPSTWAATYSWTWGEGQAPSNVHWQVMIGLGKYFSMDGPPVPPACRAEMPDTQHLEEVWWPDCPPTRSSSGVLHTIWGPTCFRIGWEQRCVGVWWREVQGDDGEHVWDVLPCCLLCRHFHH